MDAQTFASPACHHTGCMATCGLGTHNVQLFIYVLIDWDETTLSRFAPVIQNFENYEGRFQFNSNFHLQILYKILNYEKNK